MAPALNTAWATDRPSDQALLDALKALSVPVIECHLSNPHTREAFRHHSYVSLVAKGVIAGFGSIGYELAIRAVLALTASKSS